MSKRYRTKSDVSTTDQSTTSYVSNTTANKRMSIQELCTKFDQRFQNPDDQKRLQEGILAQKKTSWRRFEPEDLERIARKIVK